MNESNLQNELSIRSESIQRIYNFYCSNLFFVNRRYQRKLIWTIEEKQDFIDSIIKGYPVPIFLLAETNIKKTSAFEIIDGMQRLNAIVSFIDGEYPYNGEYFDLETMVESKSLLDKEIIIQKIPKLDRKKCESIASYILPLSIYTFGDTDRIDEIFCRINSNGKHLSNQELRTAGALKSFSNLVRNISSEIRTDVSSSNILNLRKMKDISITNYKLEYGISADNLFWVMQNIITKEMVRDSRDEEIVADSLASIALSDDEYPSSSSTVLDEYYGFRESTRTINIENSISKIGEERLKHEFLQTYDEIRRILNLSNKNFQSLVFHNPAQRLPRYFEIIFLAFHKLLYKENKEINNYEDLIKKLDGIGDHIKITSGGNWSAKNKTDNINAVTGIISSCFSTRAVKDPGSRKWLTEFETILSQSRTEQTLYDFKQGFLRLDGKNEFDDDNFSKIIKTLTAMANNSRDSVGYVCVGVADSSKSAEKVTELFKVEPTKYQDFLITGIGHEPPYVKTDLDGFFLKIVQKVKEQPIDKKTKDILSKELRLIKYFDKDIIVFRIYSNGKPMIYDEKYYRRHGANVDEIKPQEYPDFFSQY